MALFGAAAVRHGLTKINVAPALMPQISHCGIAAVVDRYDGSEKSIGGALKNYINQHTVDLLCGRTRPFPCPGAHPGRTEGQHALQPPVRVLLQH
jgi:hypothetical protein